MAACLIHRDSGLAELVRSYRSNMLRDTLFQGKRYLLQEIHFAVTPHPPPAALGYGARR